MLTARIIYRVAARIQGTFVLDTAVAWGFPIVILGLASIVAPRNPLVCISQAYN